MSSFGKRIRTLRNQADLTLNEVAQHLGIKVSFLSDVEHGRKSPLKPNLISRFAEIIICDIKELQSLAAQSRSSIEIPLKNTKINDLAFALARSADSGDTSELKLEIEKFLEQEDS